MHEGGVPPRFLVELRDRLAHRRRAFNGNVARLFPRFVGHGDLRRHVHEVFFRGGVYADGGDDGGLLYVDHAEVVGKEQQEQRRRAEHECLRPQEGEQFFHFFSPLRFLRSSSAAAGTA